MDKEILKALKSIASELKDIKREMQRKNEITVDRVYEELKKSLENSP